MERPRDILNAYINFRKKIKKLMSSKNSSLEQCIIITKEDMANWKNYYDYSKNLVYNNSLINSWESKVKAKYGIQKPKFHILKDYNAIKNHLSKQKGISFVNQEFINHYIPSDKIFKLNCHFGYNKIIIELTGGYTFNDCLVCKIGSKSTLEYVLFETIKNYKSSIINDIIKKGDSSIKQKINFTLFTMNKIITYKCKKVQNNNLGYDRNVINQTNQNNINNYGSNRQGNFSNNNKASSNSNEGNIPDFIIELLILMYKLSKDIKYKLASKDKSSEDFYILNADFLSQIKMIYNYKGISEEVQKINYISENEFTNKIPGLINSIRQKEIIKEIVPLDDMKIVPNIETLYSEKHFVNFIISCSF